MQFTACVAWNQKLCLYVLEKKKKNQKLCLRSSFLLGHLVKKNHTFVYPVLILLPWHAPVTPRVMVTTHNYN